jgi:hypothetical protein
MHKGSGTRHNVNHWGCQDKEWRVAMPISQRLHYYLTADPWTAEVIRETTAVYRSYERTAGIAPSMMSAFTAILTQWEMEHQAADEQALANFADAIAAAVRPDGLFTDRLHVDLATGKGHPVGDKAFVSHFFLNVFGGQHALVEYVELTGHAKLAEALARYAGYHAADPQDLPNADHTFRSPSSAMPFLALALRMTGEDRFQRALRGSLPLRGTTRYDWTALETVGGPGPLDEEPHQRLASPTMRRRNKIACSLGEILHQIPFGLAALDVEGMEDKTPPG